MSLTQKPKLKNLHLALSSVVVIFAALIYGANPSKILPLFFDFPVEVVELKNIFRSIMGLYLGFATYWIFGISNTKYWRSATLTNIIFMGGLSFGRIISLLLDGFSSQYFIGLLLEIGVMIWGIINLRKYS